MTPNATSTVVLPDLSLVLNSLGSASFDEIRRDGGFVSELRDEGNNNIIC